MKKLMESFDKTPSARLLDSASRSSSASGGTLCESALYQNYQNGECGGAVPAERNVEQPQQESKVRRAKNGGDEKSETSGRIVHRIRANDDDPDPLCILGCCGKGRFTILWTVTTYRGTSL